MSVVLGLQVEDLAEFLLDEMLLGNKKKQPGPLLESWVTLAIFDPHAAPARGAESRLGLVIALDVHKMLLDTELAFGLIHLNTGLKHPQVVGVKAEAVAGKSSKHVALSMVQHVSWQVSSFKIALYCVYGC